MMQNLFKLAMMQNLFKLAMMQKNFAWNRTLSLKKVNSLKGIKRGKAYGKK